MMALLLIGYLLIGCLYLKPAFEDTYNMGLKAIDRYWIGATLICVLLWPLLAGFWLLAIGLPSFMDWFAENLWN